MTWTGIRTIMVLELRQRVRATRWRVMLGIWVAVLILLCGGLAIAVETASPENATNEYLLPLYDVVVCFVLGIGLIVAPTLSATSINGDRADATLALLQATALRSQEIVVGKLLAAWVAAIAFLAVATPFLVLVVVGALIDPVAALVLVACIPFVPLSIALFQRFVRDDSSASREMRARLSAQFLEAIQGLSTLVGIGAADRVGERLARTGEDNRLAVMRVLARNQLILFVMEGVFSLFLVTAAIVVSWIRPPR